MIGPQIQNVIAPTRSHSKIDYPPQEAYSWMTRNIPAQGSQEATGNVFTPGRYVGAEPQEDDGVPFAEKMAQLTAQWRAQQEEARRLDDAIAENLNSLGF